MKGSIQKVRIMKLNKKQNKTKSNKFNYKLDIINVNNDENKKQNELKPDKLNHKPDIIYRLYRSIGPI